MKNRKTDRCEGEEKYMGGQGKHGTRKRVTEILFTQSFLRLRYNIGCNHVRIIA